VIINGTGIKPLASIKKLLKSNLPSKVSFKFAFEEAFGLILLWYPLVQILVDSR